MTGAGFGLIWSSPSARQSRGDAWQKHAPIAAKTSPQGIASQRSASRAPRKGNRPRGSLLRTKRFPGLFALEHSRIRAPCPAKTVAARRGTTTTATTASLFKSLLSVEVATSEEAQEFDLCQSKALTPPNPPITPPTAAFPPWAVGVTSSPGPRGPGPFSRSTP